MEEQGLQDYFIAVKKRKTTIIVIFFIIILLTVAIAYILPPVFKSGSTILIEQQEIPIDLVRSTITSYASERIQVIQARVMTRTNLFKIIDKFKLYEDERKIETKEEIVIRMREDVSLDFISADVVDPRTGKPTTATIAFSLSYESDSPVKAQRVANELTSLYLDENISSRTQEALATSDFLKEESNRLGKQIDELEAKLAKFKQQHAKALPEIKSLNVGSLQRKEIELTTIDARIGALEEKVFSLRTQLSQTDTGSTTSEERLEQLQSIYASLKAKYSSEHPDLVQVKNEIESFEAIRGKANNSDDLAERLDVLEKELVNKETTYTAEHPDVVSLKNKVEALQKELTYLNNNPVTEHYDENPKNPVYISLKTQLSDYESSVKLAKEERKQILNKISELEKSLYEAPQVEREYLTLRRDYSNAVVRYNDTKSKQMQADIAQQLELESKGERFTLIEPATYPEKPISPNRPAIIIIGLILSLVSSFGFAIVADIISGTVRGAKKVNQLLGAMPLSVIPFEMNLQDYVKVKKIKKRIILLFLVIIVSAILFIHFLISPLDVLWFRILRKFEIFTA